jgi:hypothetical protein
MITVEINTTQAVASIQARSPLILEAIARKMNGLNIALQAHIVGNKLSGQVLKHRSGKLANSIRVNQAQIDGETITSSVQGAGGPAFYGRLHEYGTDRSYRIVPVNKKALAFILDGKKVVVKSVLHPPIKERSFMRTSFAEMQDRIIEGIRQTFSETVNG